MHYFAVISAKKLEACPQVIQHLSYGEEGCPTHRFCSDCSSRNQCKFITTYRGHINPETDAEYHIDLYNKYVNIRILSKIREYLVLIEKDVEKLED
jgi:hypothetical protein